MIAFSIETSSSQGSICIQKKDDGKPIEILGEKIWEKEKSHSEIVTLYAEELLNELDLNTSHLDLYCVGLGPGSFTGLRIGINLVRALAFLSNTPVSTVNTLELIAYSAIGHELPTLVMTNAFKRMVYCAVYNSDGSERVAPCALTVPKLEELLLRELSLGTDYLCLGDGYEVYKSLFSEQFVSRLRRQNNFSDAANARTLGQICLDPHGTRPLLSWSEVVPLYIRASEAEEKLRQGLLKPLPQL